MTDRLPQSALRDLRAHLVRPMTVTALAGSVTVLVLAGPFGTLHSLSLGARAGYWGAVVLCTYVTGAAIDIAVRPRLARRGRVSRMTALTLTTALAVTVVVAGLNRLLLGVWPATGGLIWTLASIFTVAAVATLLLQVKAETAPAAIPAAQGPPPLMDRLPLERRGALVALSVEDHYVRIRTTRGETMLLMRLGDAIREAAPTPGLQVHRSHWVARDAVKALRRDGDRAILEMTVGGDIPASRSHIPALREAGLLPR